MNPVYTVTSYFLKIQYIAILSCHLSLDLPMFFFIQVCHLRYCIHSSCLMPATYESISTLYRFYNRNSPDVWWRKQIAKLVCVVCVLSVTAAVYTPKQNTWRSAVSVDKCRYRLGASWPDVTRRYSQTRCSADCPPSFQEESRAASTGKVPFAWLHIAHPP